MELVITSDSCLEVGVTMEERSPVWARVSLTACSEVLGKLLTSIVLLLSVVAERVPCRRLPAPADEPTKNVEGKTGGAA